MESQPIKTIFLNSGELFLSKDPIIIHTVLGSCIATCLYDPINKIGGSNHYMLPKQTNSSPPSIKYGEHAIEELIKQLISRGCRKKNLTAKLVGGSSPLKNTSQKIGEKNIHFAKEYLSKEGIPIIYEDCGGKTGRVIKYYPHCDKLLIRLIGTEQDRVSASSIISKKTLIAPETQVYELSGIQNEFLSRNFTYGMKAHSTSLSWLLRTEVDLKLRNVFSHQTQQVQEFIRKSFNYFALHLELKTPEVFGTIVLLSDPISMRAFTNLLLSRSQKHAVNFYSKKETNAVHEWVRGFIQTLFRPLSSNLGFSIEISQSQLLQKLESVNSIPFMQKKNQEGASLILNLNLNISSINLKTSLLLIAEMKRPFGFSKKNLSKNNFSTN